MYTIVLTGYNREKHGVSRVMGDRREGRIRRDAQVLGQSQGSFSLTSRGCVHRLAETTRSVAGTSGGAGFLSTASDYARFLQMPIVVVRFRPQGLVPT